MPAILILAVESPSGAPVAIGKTDARDLLLTTAHRLVTESRERVDALRAEDPLLGELQAREATHIENVLGLVLLELRVAATVC